MPTPEKHICGACESEFETRAKYLAHTCSVSGAKPATVKHLDATSDGRFSQQSEAALARGEARKGEKAHPAEGK